MELDDKIRKNVIDEIRWDPQLTKIAPQIGVTVKNEVVTLSGNVDYYSQKLAAEKAAERVSGVKVVAVDIEVSNTDFSDVDTDSKIGEAVRNALVWHSSVNEDQINIKVEDGWVYLDGTATWDFERKAAEKAIEGIRGIKGIINKVTVKNKSVEPDEIKKKISLAFLRHARVDASKILVSASGSEVKLTGTVRSWTERKDAEDVAWSMPGVTQVENKLEIEHEVYVGD